MASLQDLINERRKQLPSTPPGATEKRRDYSPPGNDGEVRDIVGLALSGGGIRSATFCFGLLQSLAASKLLRRVDVMSTVSGGGYIGSMVGSLYNKTADYQQVADVTAALGNARSKWFTWWLRANGRYLIPRGAKDSIFAGALYARNLLGVHFELAQIALLVGVFLAAFDMTLWALVANQAYDATWGQHVMALMRHVPSWLPSISVLWLPLALAALVLSTSYWSLPWVADSGRIKKLRPLVALIVGIVVVWYVVTHQPAAIDPDQSRSGQIAQWTLWGLALLFVLSWLVSLVLLWAMLRITREDGDVPWIVRAARSRVTRWLAACLRAAGVVLLLALVHRAAWYLAFEFEVVGAMGIALAIAAAVLRAVLPSAAGLALGASSTRVLLAVGRGAGYLLAFLLTTIWISLVYRAGLSVLFWRTGEPPYGLAVQALLAIVVPVTGYVIVTGRNFDFLNLSSLHGFYRARLSRSYLGAANPKRFELGGLKDLLGDVPPDMLTDKTIIAVDDLHPQDDPRFADYKPQRNGGPVHLMNVCVNQTRDPRGGLFNQDRRGLLLTVASGGIQRVSQSKWEPLPSASDLTLGGWMAVSGAAVAPGLGRLTRGGISALATFAGVRLGYWWQRESLSTLEAMKPSNWFVKSAGILRETLGIFRGTERRDWFLTDGGHFDNTGAYALLAERAKLIILADCGADPDYRFEDLENLVRKARIDLQAEIHFLQPKLAKDATDKAQPQPPWAAFGGIHDLSSANSTACLALAHVRYGGSKPGEGLLVIVKPAICNGLPVDLLNFKVSSPKFPQETTADQFFSEAQWDAYFELGSYIGSKLPIELLAEISTVMTAFGPDATKLEAVKARADDNRFVSALGRGPAQLAAMTAAGATLSLGTVTAAGVAAWQAIESVKSAAEKKSDEERKAVAELAAAWGKLHEPARAIAKTTGVAATSAAWAPASPRSATPASGVAAAGGYLPREAKPADPKEVAALATILVRTADNLCGPGEAGWFAKSTVAHQAYRDAISHCREIDLPRPSACQVLLEADHPRLLRPLPDCLRKEQAILSYTRTPRNWYYDYSRVAQPEAAHPCDETAANRTVAEASLGQDERQLEVSRVASALAEHPSAERCSKPERGVQIQQGKSQCASGRRIRVLVQIFDPADRDVVDSWIPEFRSMGLDMPPAEDVVASARANGRVEPWPARVSSIFYTTTGGASIVDGSAGIPDIKGCAERLGKRLVSASDPQAKVKIENRPSRGDGSEDIIEVWVAPGVLRKFQVEVAAAPSSAPVSAAKPPPIAASGTAALAPSITNYAADVGLLSGPDRRAVSARLSSIPVAEQGAVVQALLDAVVTDPNKPFNYRQNLYIAYTLAKMKGGWPDTPEAHQKICGLRKTDNYRDATFKERVDEAIKNAKFQKTCS